MIKYNMNSNPYQKNKPLKAVFMGTPGFAAAHLEALLHHPDLVTVEAVYTQPDRPRGRSRTPAPSEVKEVALAYQIPVFQAENFNSKEKLDQLKTFAPDILIVVAFGMILPDSVLAIPSYGAINIHASLLPKYRGASPIQYALLNGESLTGVTSFLLDLGVDTGQILLQKEIKILSQDNYDSLSIKLASLGKECLIETLTRIQETELSFKGFPQDKKIGSYARKITKEMGALDFNKSAHELHNQIRALHSWPTCHFRAQADKLEETEIKLHKTEVIMPCTLCESRQPGELHYLPQHHLHIRTGNGCLNILELQLPGKKKMAIQEFLNGHCIGSIHP